MSGSSVESSLDVKQRDLFQQEGVPQELLKKAEAFIDAANRGGMDNLPQAFANLARGAKEAGIELNTPVVDKVTTFALKRAIESLLEAARRYAWAKDTVPERLEELAQAEHFCQRLEELNPQATTGFRKTIVEIKQEGMEYYTERRLDEIRELFRGVREILKEILALSLEAGVLPNAEKIARSLYNVCWREEVLLQLERDLRSHRQWTEALEAVVAGLRYISPPGEKQAL